jgi:hypothetical protein
MNHRASRLRLVVLRVAGPMLHRVDVSHAPHARPIRPVRPVRPIRPIRLLACLLVVLLAAGCGRKATHEDCEAVVDKNVELQLKALGVVDPATVNKRRDEMRASMKDDIDKCVGKRVTDTMISCVKNAETTEKIDKCLR